jgi:hypothetical protein
MQRSSINIDAAIDALRRADEIRKKELALGKAVLYSGFSKRQCRSVSPEVACDALVKAKEELGREVFLSELRLKVRNGLDGVRQKTRRAVRSGKLKRLPCKVCGDPRSVAHHDYSNPLEVVWLCNRHHSELHQKRNRERL